MFHSSVVVDVSLSPAGFIIICCCSLLSIVTIIFVYDVLCCTRATHTDFLLLFHWLSYSVIYNSIFLKFL